ncbi:MAG: shikimate kinase [Bacteroidetes bacterium OLB12]|nr:MAG: shikimate kinase [Bacteroidetes bacterium OLB12]HNR74899.1 shikimate kinase [Cyclobacteriaceae bacterium]HNU41570.1 shikimate kinase [Cyclobacteriaceae bacterium]
MKIYLIGLPGCGKSTLGKQLARHLGIKFIDLDQEIEKIVSVPVRDIFKKYGESFFRKQESEILREMSDAHMDFVMATGGGAPVFFDNMKFMNATGQTIFLDVPAREITNRISQSSKEERPLLASLAPDELKDKIEFLRSQRITFYSQAHITLTGIVQLSELISALKS